VSRAMIAHWDDVPWTAHDHGQLSFERQRLAAAAGAANVGLSHFRVAPGARQMPQHVHADEEEIFFVLDGTGLSWHGDVAHEVAAGDTIVHVAQRDAHCMIAGPDAPLDVLAFASGTPTGLTTLPRAGITWIGERRLPADSPHPYEAEPPLDALPPVAPQPPSIVALAEVESRTGEHGTIRRTRRDLGRAAGSLTTGMKHVELPPGARAAPRHCHSAEEELFVVLDGDGVVRLGDDAHAVSRGSVVARPAGTGVAHDFQAGDGGMTFLAYGTRKPDDICWYPDSQKIYFIGVDIIARVEQLDYWDGEG
jgi:uncharacterized cupin superfamily protein